MNLFLKKICRRYLQYRSLWTRCVLPYVLVLLCAVSCSDADGARSPQTSETTVEVDTGFTTSGDVGADTHDADTYDVEDDTGVRCVPSPEGDARRLETPAIRSAEVVCMEEDADIWSFMLRRGEVFSVELENLGGDLDLVLLEESDGREVATSRTAETLEVIGYQVRRDGVYTLRVEPFESTRSEDFKYNLKAEVEEPLVCDSALEPNDTDAMASLLLRQGNAASAQSRVQGAVCTGDRDVFLIDVSSSEGMQLNLEGRSDTLYGSARLSVLNAQNVTIASVGPDREGLLSLRVRLPSSGLFYAVLDHLEGSHVPYTLDATLTPVVRCSDDPSEPNDRLTSAKPWDTREGISGVACEEDPDFFSLAPIAGRINAWGVSLMWVGPSPPNLTLEDPIGRILGEGREDDGTLRLVWGNATAQPSLLHIEHEGPAEPTPYTLTATHIVGVEDLSCDDINPNNTPEESAPLNLPTTRGTLCSTLDEVDVYSLSLTEGEVVNARLEFTPSSGDMDLILTDETGELIEGSSRTRLPFEEIILSAPRTGTYLLHVLASGPVAGRYLLKTQLLEAPLCEDLLEPNNIFQEATFAESPIRALHVCDEDPDFYRIPVEHERAFVEVSVAHNGLFGDVDLRLLGLDQEPLGASLGIEANYVQVAVDTPGDYIAEVRAALGSVVPYELVWAVTRRPDCEEDIFEPNNTTPTPLDAPARAAIVCDDDVDLYTVDIQAENSTLAVILDPTLSLGFARLEILAPDGETILAALDRIPPGSETEHGGHSGDERPQAQLIHIFQPVAIPGAYTLRVTRIQGGDVVYDMIAAELPPTTCPSPFEPNDKPIAAQPLLNGISSNLVYCPTQPSNLDYFSIELDAFEALNVLALYDTEGPDMALIAPDGETRLVEAFSARGDIELQYVAPEAGTYYLLITAVTSQPFPYSLSVERR